MLRNTSEKRETSGSIKAQDATRTTQQYTILTFFDISHFHLVRIKFPRTLKLFYRVLVYPFTLHFYYTQFKKIIFGWEEISARFKTIIPKTFLAANVTCQRSVYYNIMGFFRSDNILVNSVECVMKIWGAGKGFKGFAHMMTHYLNTRRWLADTFV